MMPLLHYAEIQAQIDAFDPIAYDKTRNYLDGAVSRLSPYLSRGVISIGDVYQRLKAKGFTLHEMEAFVMELCWREHAQRIWQHHNPQVELRNKQLWIQDYDYLPNEILSAQTGIDAIDQALLGLFKTGYMHNHMRMYVASLVCNHYGAYWKTAAKWMFSLLCDADAASNHLSWQWVCGANAPKVYFANQENINKYAKSNQHQTFLDTSYDKLPQLKIECDWVAPSYAFVPKNPKQLSIDTNLPTYLYTPYHLDPEWRYSTKGNRILFWDLSHWQEYPFTEQNFNWINDLAKLNIPDIQIYVGHWDNLATNLKLEQCYTKEHPLMAAYPIDKDARDWLLPDFEKAPGSFFNFWKKVHKHLSNEQ